TILYVNLVGTLVSHAQPLKVVVPTVANREKVIVELGTDRVVVPFLVTIVTFWLVNLIVPPDVAPAGFSTLLNQIQLACWMAVPLKFDSILACGQVGGCVTLTVTLFEVFSPVPSLPVMLASLVYLLSLSRTW